MSDWNDALDKARQEFPDPFNDPARTKKGRGWGKQTPVRVPPELSEVMGAVYTSHPLHHKDAAPGRVMKKAAQYHAAETNRRMAKYSNRKTDRRGAMVTIAIMLPICLCLASILANYIP